MKLGREGAKVSRRDALRWAAGAAVTAGPLGHSLLAAAVKRGPAATNIPLSSGWTISASGSSVTETDISLPRSAVKLSWQGWDPTSWQHLWEYRRSFTSPVKAWNNQRVFLRFEGVMSGGTPSINGHQLESQLGGFLPWEREITGYLKEQNELLVTVDGNWLNVPPSGSPKGSKQVDYLLPAGIHREVSLRVLPQIFLDEVFAKPVDVLGPNRALEIQCTLDAAAVASGKIRIEARLLDGTSLLSVAATSTAVNAVGRSQVSFTMGGLQGVGLWSPENPKLYNLQLTLHQNGKPAHEFVTRVGFREAKFTADGFFLNGEKVRIFGLNRHELFPYTGFAMPERVMRHDAELLKHELNLNTVRCSHYPQTEAFLDACDELGLMIWEEIPGWQYIGDAAWQDLLVRDIRSMVVRDRNHPSIIIWGVRVNESANDPPLYAKTTALAKSLDDSRPCSGTMTHEDLPGWSEDVYTYDDYHNGKNGKLEMHKPIPGVPFLFGEAVGQFGYEHGGGFKQYYRRTGVLDIVESQAKYHAQGHDRAAVDPQVSGLIAWCAFDYASLVNSSNAVKYPGVVDTFRIPKLGATFYQAQVSPAVRPVIQPSFYWDFSEGNHPGPEAHIFSNCDRLLVSVGKSKPMTAMPDKAGYPKTAYPPFIVDLSSGKAGDELVIEGFVGVRSVLKRTMSSDRSKDKLALSVDDAAISNDGVDMTRVWFAICDCYGASVRCLDGDVAIVLTGPAEMVGDSSFAMAETGGVGAVWVRLKRNKVGTIQVSASHPRFGTQTVSIAAKFLA